MQVFLDKFIPELVGSGDTAAPHLLDGNVYVTNRSILLKAPAAYFSTEAAAVPRFPDCEPVFATIESAARESGVLLSLTLPFSVFMAAYDNLPKEPVYDDCKECDGEGRIECEHCGHEAKCEKCKGTGEGKNKIGESIDVMKHRLMIGDCPFDATSLLLMMNIGKALGYENVPIILNDARGLLGAQLGDVTIMIAGCRRGSEGKYHPIKSLELTRL